MKSASVRLPIPTKVSVSGGLADNKIAISNDGTDTTITVDLDTDGAEAVGLTVTLVGVAFDSTDFTFDATNELLTLV